MKTNIFLSIFFLSFLLSQEDSSIVNSKSIQDSIILNNSSNFFVEDDLFETLLSEAKMFYAEAIISDLISDTLDAMYGFDNVFKALAQLEEISENDELDKTTRIIRATAPGALELAAVAKQHILKHNDCIGIIFNGIVIRGETIHYQLVTNETFRSIGSLAESFCNIAIINNVICVENLAQLEKRLVKNTKNNTNTKTPGISDVPVVGNLFKGKNKTDELKELLIFIAPRVIQ